MIERACVICEKKFSVKFPSQKKITCSHTCKNFLIGHRLNSRKQDQVFDYTKKHCSLCNELFKPSSGAQRWCKSCVPDRVSEKRAQRYKISKIDFDRMLKDQNGICALCEKNFSVVDHDHETLRVRGLLCNGCNIALNRVELSGWVQRALTYIEKGK